MTSYTDNNYGCKWKPRKVSAKRDFPYAFSDVTNESSSLVKKHKVCESPKGSYNCNVGPDKEVLDFIPLETEIEIEKEKEYVSSESCGSGTRESRYDIIPRFVNATTRGSDEGIGKLGVSTELRIHGVCLKEIKWYETADGLKIELSVDKLQKRRVDDESFEKESRACESVADQVRNERERVKRYEEVCSRRRPVSAVRSYPQGCGPVKRKICVGL